MKKQEFQKMRRGLGIFGKTFNIPTSKSRDARRRRGRARIENFFEQIIKENFPNLVKESSGSPKEVGPKDAQTKTHHNYITQD